LQSHALAVDDPGKENAAKQLGPTAYRSAQDYRVARRAKRLILLLLFLLALFFLHFPPKKPMSSPKTI
jgi:hypothetical protein